MSTKAAESKRKAAYRKRVRGAVEPKRAKHPRYPWMVESREGGKRVRRFFEEFTEAETFAEKQNVKLENLGWRIEHLTGAELEDAMAARREVEGMGFAALMDAVREFVLEGTATNRRGSPNGLMRRRLKPFELRLRGSKTKPLGVARRYLSNVFKAATVEFHHPRVTPDGPGGQWTVDRAAEQQVVVLRHHSSSLGEMMGIGMPRRRRSPSPLSHFHWTKVMMGGLTGGGSGDGAPGCECRGAGWRSVSMGG